MADLPFPDSLCHRCVHLRHVVASRSTFLLCREPTLPKYAAQPVRVCPRFLADHPERSDPSG